MRLFRHLAGQLVIDGDGLFAEDVLSCRECLHRDRIMREVRCQDKNHLCLGIFQRDPVIGYRIFNQPGIFALFRLRLFRNEIAGVFDSDISQVFQRREMTVGGDSAAADHCGDDFFIHCDTSSNRFLIYAIAFSISPIGSEPASRSMVKNPSYLISFKAFRYARKGTFPSPMGVSVK